MAPSIGRVAGRVAGRAAGGGAVVSLVVVVFAAGCFVADAPPDTTVACASVDDCPPSHRCELALGRCLPDDETVPQASALSTTTNEDEAVDVALRGLDADGDALRFLVTPPDPAAGTLGAVRGDTVTFAPAPDFAGTATFSYVVEDDAGLASPPATVTVTVIPKDDPPFFLAPPTLVTDEDQLLQVNVDLFDRLADGRDAETLQVIDVDTFELAVVVGDSAVGATIGQQPDGDIVYKPPLDFFGTDELAVTARCGGQETTHRLAIVVAPVNDPPTLKVADLSTQEGTAVERLLDMFDVDDEPEDLAVTVEALPASVGIVTVLGAADARVLRFVPAEGFVGSTAVTVSVVDAAGASAERRVELRVFPIIAAPGARSATAAVSEDDVVVVDLADLSIGPDGLSWGIEAPPLHGALDTARLGSG
ncbi:MAG: tandem-95 repeat protein [Deltaproteobacteria bacterium]|nr:tandem-95 repeat protein [Deltaproteobacteria bacterium]